MPTRDLPWIVDPPAPGPGRRLAAAALRLAGASLELLARRIGCEATQASIAAAPHLEFYAEASAPEGALYVDGVLAGRLPVSRL